jgi:hypothetical protein
MQEILSKSDDPKVPLRDQEFYELRLFEKINPLGTRHFVSQNHAVWSERDQQIMFEGEEVDYFRILAEAKKRYAERRLALAEKGFIYSDMDLLQGGAKKRDHPLALSFPIFISGKGSEANKHQT